ncbi:hypothetical protein M3C58_09650 [Brachybacterium muris]|uniref:hypothetical protein n=1 Tax=Brachybacterium muris TaxID=219301 RepID=UPI0021A28544|nr:hypothetical protein [Brachybacterium muris]MCT1998449.1 hypothetical protein [Brachybacterium muris]
MDSNREHQPSAEANEPTRTFSPPGRVVLGTLLIALVFVVVLEFLVIISFVGQRLWRDPALTSDLGFTLPLLLWVAVAVLAVIGVLRVVTAWLHVDEKGFRLQGLCRSTLEAPWKDVARVIAVRDIDRGASPAEALDSGETSYDGVYLMDAHDHRMLAVSSRLFGDRAQETVLRHAENAGVPVDHYDAIRPRELRKQVPQALTFIDRHPNLLLLGLVVFYVFHNVYTFVVWGL